MSKILIFSQISVKCPTHGSKTPPSELNLNNSSLDSRVNNNSIKDFNHNFVQFFYFANEAHAERAERKRISREAANEEVVQSEVVSSNAFTAFQKFCLAWFLFYKWTQLTFLVIILRFSEICSNLSLWWNCPLLVFDQNF